MHDAKLRHSTRSNQLKENEMGSLAKQLGGQSQVKVFKSGGKVKHDDEKQDKALIAKMIKAESKTEKKFGGKVKAKK